MRRQVLHPDSKFRSTWNVLLAFFILYCCFAVPLEIAFETDMVSLDLACAGLVFLGWACFDLA